MAARATLKQSKTQRIGTSTSPLREAPAPRVVYTEPPLRLATPVEPAGGGWRVRVGTTELVARLHPSVDPALVAEVAQHGGRVVLEQAPDAVIAGVLQTSRALSVDAKGDVKAEVRRLEIDARDRVLLRAPGSFVSVSAREVELYSSRVVTRARELAKILAAMIKLN